MTSRRDLCSVACALGMLASASCAGGDPGNIGNLGGAVHGLTTAGLTLRLNDNASTDVSVPARADHFAFRIMLLENRPYNVTVQTQPAGEVCTVINGQGTMGSGAVDTIVVFCSTSVHAVGGKVSGLSDTQAVQLQLNGQPYTVTGSGTYTFPNAIPVGAGYRADVLSTPAGTTCAIVAGAGTMADADVTDVDVSCSANTHAVGGTVTGLAATESVQLQLNGQPYTVTGSVSYQFPGELSPGAAYAVTLSASPAGKTCSVANAGGNMADSDVTDVDVTCAASTHKVGGSVSGVTATESVTLQLQGQSYTVTGSGAFAFPGPIPVGAAYTVTVASSPTGKGCRVANASGTMGDADVTSVSVTCAVPTWTTVPTNSKQMGFTGVWGSGANDIWAVGDFGTTSHWLGSSFATSTDPDGVFSLSVWGSGPGDVWRVGYQGGTAHWDGSTWWTIASGTTNQLWYVWGTSASDVWAVGVKGTILHWTNTGSWLSVTNPLSGSSTDLRGLWGSTASDVWAVGNGAILRWNGTKWASYTSPTSKWLIGVWGSAANDVWAVGGSGTIAHFNGTAWSLVNSPTINTLLSVWGSGPKDVWAGGIDGTMLHYDGTSWTTVSNPLSGTAQWIESIWGTGPTNVWAVSTVNDSTGGSFLHYAP